MSDLNPFDVKDDNMLELENRIDRFDKVSIRLQRRFYRIKEDMKARKFTHKPDLLEEDFISCSQFSVLQSQVSEDEELSDVFSQQSLEEEQSRGN